LKLGEKKTLRGREGEETGVKENNEKGCYGNERKSKKGVKGEGRWNWGGGTGARSQMKKAKKKIEKGETVGGVFGAKKKLLGEIMKRSPQKRWLTSPNSRIIGTWRGEKAKGCSGKMKSGWGRRVKNPTRHRENVSHRKKEGENIFARKGGKLDKKRPLELKEERGGGKCGRPAGE